MKVIRMAVFMLLIILSSVAMGLNYNVPYTEQVPVIDGVLSAGEWEDAKSVSMLYPDIAILPHEGAIHQDLYEPENAADLSGTWYLKWDYQNLYIACMVNDQDLRWLIERGAGNYSQDGVQFDFNFKNDPLAEYRTEAAVYDFAPRTATNSLPDIYKRDPGVYELQNGQIGSTIYPDGYLVEVKMSWSDFDSEYSPNFNGAEEPNNIHGVGLVLIDYDGDTIVSPGSSIMSDFGKGIYTGSDVSSWNTITLVEELVCGDRGYLDADLNKDCIVDLNDSAILAENWLISYKEE